MSPEALQKEVAAALAWLKARGTQKNIDGMARYGITVSNGKVFGVSMATMHALAKKLGTHHALALALWDSGWYEARILTSFVADPEQLSPALMDRWTRAFDNWAICDTLCFHLFDRSPHAWKKVHQWADAKEEFVKRTSFALLASLAGHDKTATDEQFLDTLPLIERAADDERNFVRKGVNWALRRIATRSRVLFDACKKLAEKLEKSPQPHTRWIGKDALREFAKPAMAKRLAALDAKAAKAAMGAKAAKRK
jgi:3-methyladenine DNA glycosylase AlkD